MCLGVGVDQMFLSFCRGLGLDCYVFVFAMLGGGGSPNVLRGCRRR